MTRINLVIPFSLKNQVKEQHPKIRWDMNKKTWFYNNENNDMPEDLKKYTEMSVKIKYEDREEYKNLFNSLKWCQEEKTWKCSFDDFLKIQKYRGEEV